MAGRCTECGTYHYDGPPCDNCGEMGFIPAVKVKKCAECGAVHRDEGPPCRSCGAMGFQRLENPDTFLESGVDSDSSVDDQSIPSTGANRRDVLKYGVVGVGVLAAGGYVFLSSDDHPTTTAPGQADEASGIRFETVETEIRGLVNDERENQGVGTLSTAGNVDAFATYYNKQYVKQGGGNVDGIDNGEFDGEFNVSDYYIATNYYGGDSAGRAITAFDSAVELARDCVDSWMAESRFRDPLTSSDYANIGLDVHTNPEGGIFLVVVVD